MLILVSIGVVDMELSYEVENVQRGLLPPLVVLNKPGAMMALCLEAENGAHCKPLIALRRTRQLDKGPCRNSCARDHFQLP